MGGAGVCNLGGKEGQWVELSGRMSSYLETKWKFVSWLVVAGSINMLNAVKTVCCPPSTIRPAREKLQVQKQKAC